MPDIAERVEEAYRLGELAEAARHADCCVDREELAAELAESASLRSALGTKADELRSVRDLLGAERKKREVVEQERDEYRRICESLCSWLGVLLTSLSVSTLEDGVKRVTATKRVAELD